MAQNKADNQHETHVQFQLLNKKATPIFFKKDSLTRPKNFGQ